MANQKFQELAQNITEDEFKEFVGINAYKFSKAKEQVLKGKLVQWSWPAFLFTAFYGAYYRYWTPALLMLSTFLLIDILSSGSLSTNIAPGFAFAIIYGFVFRTSYVKFAYKKIAKLKKLESDPERLKTILQRHGNTSKLSLLFSVFLFCAYGFSSAALYDPEFKQAFRDLNSEIESLNSESDIQNLQKSHQFAEAEHERENLEINDQGHGKEQKLVSTIGAPLHSKQFEIVVSKVKQFKSMGMIEATKGAVFVAVEYSVKNVGQKPITYEAYPDVFLIDNFGDRHNGGTGRNLVYSAVKSALENSEQETIPNTLYPGITANSFEVFEVGETLFNRDTWYIEIEADETLTVSLSENKTVFSENTTLTSEESQASALNSGETASAIATDTGMQSTENPEHEEVSRCGEPFPCQLVAIIDRADWTEVKSALAFAMKIDVTEKITWQNKQNGHSGYIIENSKNQNDSNCKQYDVASFMGSEIGTSNVTVCWQNDGSIRIE